DGKMLAIGSVASPMRVFEVQSGKLLSTTVGHRQQIWQAFFMPGGKSVFTSAVDGTWRYWDPVTGLEQDCIEHKNDWGVNVRLSHDGRTGYAYSSYIPGAIEVWDLVKRKQTSTLHLENADKRVVPVLAISPDDKLLAISEFQPGKCTIHLVDSSSGKRVQTIEDTGTDPLSATFTPDGKTLAVWC